MGDQEQRGGKFIPAFFLDVIPKGYEFPRGRWPHHVTLFPPLEAPYGPAFGDQLRTELNHHYPFIVRTAGEALFGPEDNKTAKVRLLEPSLSLQGVHYLIEKAIGDIYHDETYREPYNPHITVEQFSDVPRGMSVFIAGLAIVEKRLGGVWKVVDKVGLKGGEHEHTVR